MNFNTDYQKKCPVCGEAFEATRLNQNYCSTTCKAFFNNHKNRETSLAQRQAIGIAGPTNAILWKNRELLRQHAGQTVKLEKLEVAGFKVKYITRFEQFGASNNLFYCYDYSFTFEDNFTLKIIEK